MADGLGVDLETLSRVLEASLDGRIVTMLSTGDEDRPITIRLATPTREGLKNVVFQTARGQKVAIGEVASFVEAEGAREIFRRDQRRTAMVTAHVAAGQDYPSAIAAVVDTLQEVQLPPGLRAQFSGEEAERARTLRGTATGRYFRPGSGFHGVIRVIRIADTSRDGAGSNSTRPHRRGRDAGSAGTTDRRHGDVGINRARGRRGKRCGPAAVNRAPAHRRRD